MTTMKDKKFEQLLKQKLDGLETPPPPDVWEKIEAALPAEQAQGTVEVPRSFRLRPWVWTSAGVVAAACTLVFFMQRGAVNDAAMMGHANVSQVSAEDKPVCTLPSDSNEGSITKDSLAPLKVEARLLETMAAESEQSISVAHTVPSAGSEKTSAQQKNLASTCGSTQPQMATAETAIVNGHKETPEDSETDLERRVDGEGEASDAAEEHRAPHRVLSMGSDVAADGAGGKHRMDGRAGFSGQKFRFREGVSGKVWVSGNTWGRQTNNLPDLRAYNAVMQSPEDETVAEAMKKSDAEGNLREKHLPPFQFGLDVSFPISPRLALETGLSYSILVSTFEQGLPPVATHQKAHFLGIPLRALLGVYHKKAWDVYVGAGGKFERCVAVDAAGPDGVVDVGGSYPSQWSLQMSAGVQYQISPHAACFLEPGCGYYFDNHSALRTAYGERPVNFSLKMGIRFNISGK